MQRTLIAYCDGGLGNRLNSLIAALHLAKALGTNPVISWPINRWCAAPFEDLFDAPYEVDRRSIPEMNEENRGHLLVAHEQQAFALSRIANPNGALRTEDLLAAMRPGLQAADGIIYYNNRVPAYVRRREADAIARTIRVKREYRDHADAYLAQAGLLGKPYWGLHLRGTDAGFSRAYFAFWQAACRMLPGPVVLCTDDPALEASFLSIPSVIRRPAGALPQKFAHDKGWNEACQDEYGREFTFNIYRGADAIREAMIDFEILGRSRAVPTSRSTFLENAVRFSGQRPPLASLQDMLGWLRHAWRIARAAESVLQKA
jgi:hypothetical protein